MDTPVSEMNASQVLSPTVWPTGSKVRLLQVPWDSAYRDVVAWKGKEERDAWFAARSGSWYATNFQNLRPGEPVSVPVPYSSVYRYNYMTVTNPQQPVTDEGPERTYFYFITSAEYLSPQATRLTVQLDVMTTYAGSIEFGRAYVESGHVAMANTNLDVTDGRPNNGQTLNRYMDLPEGIDCGNTLVPVHREMMNLLPNGDDNMVVIIVSTADLENDPGSIANPSLKTATGQIADGLYSGCNVYAVPRENISSILSNMSSYPWVAQCIICMYAYPTALINKGSAFTEDNKVTIFQFDAYKMDEVFARNSSITGVLWDNPGIFETLAQGLGSDADLTKLYTYPYSVIELSCFNGNPIFLKPQLLRDNHIAFKAIANALMPFAKAAIFPENYGSPDKTGGQTYQWSGIGYAGDTYIANGDFLDTAVWITDFPQFSLVNNAYITYMASTAHTRAYQYDTAGWRQTKGNLQAMTAQQDALQVSNTQSLNARTARDTQLGNIGRSYQTNLDTMFYHGTAGVGSAALSFLNGNAAGAGSELLNTGAAALSAYSQANAQKANDTATASTNAANTVRMANAQGDIAGRDYNTAIAINQGDYKNAVAGINASVQDAQLTPPSTVGQMGGNGFNWANGYVGVCVTFKCITGAAKEAISDYFRRYGYAVKRFITLGTVADMLCMTKFAYWRVLESNITCAGANETEREAMRGIMEKGVTLWASPELIGNTDVRTNEVRTDGKQYAF